jgi:predicted DNA-binding protein with PD1-like motif
LETAIDGNLIIAKLDDGEDLFEGIKSILAWHSVKSAVVLTGIGMLTNFELGYFVGKSYRNNFYSEPHELVALHGSVTTKGETVVHLHAALAGPEHRLVGGHLQKATVKVVNEIALLKIEGFEMSRKADPTTGLKLLTVR